MGFHSTETNLGLQVGGAFELNNLVDLSLDGLGYHRKSQSKATIEQLLECFADLANQAMRHEDGLLRHGFHSANEEAIELLETLGLVELVEPEVWRWVEPPPDRAGIAKNISA